MINNNNLLYKAEKPSVHLSVLIFISVDSCVFWHEQVCFYKSVSALCWAHKCLKGTAVAPFCL